MQTTKMVQLKRAPAKVAPLPPSLINSMFGEDLYAVDRLIITANKLLLSWAANKERRTTIYVGEDYIYGVGNQIYIHIKCPLYITQKYLDQAADAFRMMGWESAYIYTLAPKTANGIYTISISLRENLAAV